MQTRALVAPWTPRQIKLESIAFSVRSMIDPDTRQIVLHDAIFQHLLISGAEVDESKVVCAGEADAGEAGRCWDASSEEEHALVVLPPRNVDGICQRPASLQHCLAYSCH